MPKYILLCASTYVSEVLISISQGRIRPDSIVYFANYLFRKVLKRKKDCWRNRKIGEIENLRNLLTLRNRVYPTKHVHLHQQQRRMVICSTKWTLRLPGKIKISLYLK